MSFGRSAYIGELKSGIDIFIPRQDGGFYNLCWWYDDELSLYNFPLYTPEKIKEQNADVNYYEVTPAQIGLVLDKLGND